MMQTEDKILEYGQMVVEFAYQNPELISVVLAGVVTYLYRYKFKGNWPFLGSLRRFALPFAQATIGKKYPVEFTREIYPREITGEYNINYKKLHKKFRKDGLIYPNNFAKLKYIEDKDGNKNWEVGSWAYRPEGLTGRYQVHLMVYATMDGTTKIAAHREISPLAAPIRHYLGSGEFNVSKGVEKAKDIMKPLATSIDSS